MCFKEVKLVNCFNFILLYGSTLTFNLFISHFIWNITEDLWNCFSLGVSENAVSGHIQLLIPGETACFACAPPLVGSLIFLNMEMCWRFHIYILYCGFIFSWLKSLRGISNLCHRILCLVVVLMLLCVLYSGYSIANKVWIRIMLSKLCHRILCLVVVLMLLCISYTQTTQVQIRFRFELCCVCWFFADCISLWYIMCAFQALVMQFMQSLFHRL